MQREGGIVGERSLETRTIVLEDCQFRWIPVGYAVVKAHWMLYLNRDAYPQQIWPPVRQATKMESKLLEKLWSDA